ncbi:uncharacterized protein N7469_010084, partial [Penicillium citrinum]
MPPKKTSSNTRKRKAVSPHRQRNATASRLSDSSEAEERSQAAEQTDVEERPEPTWSPWDPLVREKVDIKELDLDVSYVDSIPRPSLNETRVDFDPEEPQPKRKRWQRKGKKVINNIKDLPKGWDATEPDLDPKDIDAQIVRCHERIEENIFPQVFKEKLRRYEISKAYYETSPPGLSEEVYHRIKTLRTIRRQIQNADKSEQLPNVKAILQAYLDEKLQWNPGLVTYWSRGVKLCEPRPFRWDEFEVINAAHGGHKSFWTEGISGPGPQLQAASFIVPGSTSYIGINFYRLALRIPGHSWWDELEFVYDTGATIMQICRSDLRTLMGPRITQVDSFVPVLGIFNIVTGAGNVSRDVVQLECTILNSRRERITPWRAVQCAVDPGVYVEGVSRRLDGPFLRSMMYTSGVPDGNFDLHVSSINKKVSLKKTIKIKDRNVPFGTLERLPDGTQKVIFATEGK